MLSVDKKSYLYPAPSDTRQVPDTRTRIVIPNCRLTKLVHMGLTSTIVLNHAMGPRAFFSPNSASSPAFGNLLGYSSRDQCNAQGPQLAAHQIRARPIKVQDF
jgi:hypothetical protein